MATRSSRNELRSVMLQIIDEITGEPLEYVHVRTNAKNVTLSDGTFLEDVIKSLTTKLSNVQVSDARLKAALQEHLESKNLHGDMTKLANAFVGYRYDPETGVITFVKYDGTVDHFDTGMERIPVEIGFDDKTNEIVLKTDKDPEGVRISLAKLVDLYVGGKTDEADVKVTSENKILVHLNEHGVEKKHLSAALQTFLNKLDKFLKDNSDKLDSIDVNANYYELPPATEDEIGGVKPGFGLSVEEDGTMNTTNIMMGSSYDAAAPCGIFLQVLGTGGPHTDPIPEMTSGHSYITSEGNLIEYNEDTDTYNYTNNSTDGSILLERRLDQVAAKFVPGLTLIDMDDITWYHTDDLEYAVTETGEGFIYTAGEYRIFEGYLVTDEFLRLFNGGVLVEGKYEYTGEPEPVAMVNIGFLAGDNGSVSETGEMVLLELESGTASADLDLIPTPVPDEGYKFVGWSPEIPETFTDDAFYTAVFAEITEEDTVQITFINPQLGEEDDGYATTVAIVLGTASADCELIPVFEANEGYEFVGWEPELPETFTEDAAFAAVFDEVDEPETPPEEPDPDEDMVTLTFVPTDGMATLAEGFSSTVQVLRGTVSAEFDGFPTFVPNDGYRFAGWTPELPDAFTEDATYTAMFEEIPTVVATFKIPTQYGTFSDEGAVTDDDGNSVMEVELEVGTESADCDMIPMVAMNDGYTFLGWSPDIPETFTEDCEYTAVTEQITNVEPENPEEGGDPSTDTEEPENPKTDPSEDDENPPVTDTDDPETPPEEPEENSETDTPETEPAE